MYWTCQSSPFLMLIATLVQIMIWIVTNYASFGHQITRINTFLGTCIVCTVRQKKKTLGELFVRSKRDESIRGRWTRLYLRTFFPQIGVCQRPLIKFLNYEHRFSLAFELRNEYSFLFVCLFSLLFFPIYFWCFVYVLLISFNKCYFGPLLRISILKLDVKIRTKIKPRPDNLLRFFSSLSAIFVFITHLQQTFLLQRTILTNKILN